jgi:DNA polymerase-1
MREKLRAGAERIHENREMVRLDDDLPLPVALKDLKVQPRWPELIAALERCEFKGLLAEVKADAAAAQPSDVKPSQGELF